MNHKLLHLSFSPRKDSISSKIAEKFITEWINKNPNTELLHHALGIEELKGPNDNWIKANMTPESTRSDEQKQILAFSDQMIEELVNATHIVISTPMFNFTVPWSLKSYIDLILRVNKTFSFDPEKGPGPLLDTNKKLLVIYSSAFSYEKGTPMESFNQLVPYLECVFGFMGIHQITSINIDNQWAPSDIAQASQEKTLKFLSELSISW